MPTFYDLHTRLQNARHRKAIMVHLIEYIDSNFMPVADAEPKNRLLTDERRPVPTEVFEAVLADTLSAEVQQLDEEITRVLEAQLENVPERQEAPPPQPQEQPA